MFPWDKVRDTHQIQLIIANIMNPLWTPKHSILGLCDDRTLVIRITMYE